MGKRQEGWRVRGKEGNEKKEGRENGRKRGNGKRGKERECENGKSKGEKRERDVAAARVL